MDEIIRAILAEEEPHKALDDALALPLTQQEELVQRLGRLKSEASGRFLSLLYERLSNKGLRKLVKRELFHLKTLGISVEEPRMPGESVLRRMETSREALGLMSNYDSARTRVVLAAMELKKNHFLFAHAVTHFTEGLEELRSMTVSRSQLEELTQGYVARTRSPMVLVNLSPPFAAYVIEEASTISGREVEDARSLNRMLASSRGDARKPADIYLLDTGTGGAQASRDAVLEDELFQPFSLEWRGMEEDRKRLADAINPGIVLPPSVIQERKAGFFLDLVEREAVRAIMPRFKRMLEDSAYLFFCLKEPRQYSGLMGLLKEPEGVRAALIRFLDKALEEMEKKEQQQPGLIVDPHSLGRR